MKRKKSEEYFHKQPDNFNCAQTILKGFQADFNVPESMIEDYRAYGGGRAKDGICGALFAAESLLESSEKEFLEKQFAAKLGSVYCRELKKLKTPCVECVRFADELIQKRLDGSDK
ncbi:redox-active protein [Paludibacter sp. 221]|uniref:C-GCAxxG-C-C family (seleno)protein n=1 Tax=Paludibacter sp. 221 TaxID=2302939 RepID=UPI0013D78BD8|nr:C-GCAxxG-C-C family (seleno)protein [Paludibacter sp. 221]NDV47703.1 redox-active protein [Paludibacter sp. 221]